MSEEKQVKVTFSKNEISTLAVLAKELKKLYKWKSWCIGNDGSYIVFKAKDSEDGIIKEGYVGPSGFAYYLEDDPADHFCENNYWHEYDVNWDEDFDSWNDHVWGMDEEGNTVMVHN